MLPAIVPLGVLLARFCERWRLGEIQPPPWLMNLCLASLVLVGIGFGLGFAVVGAPPK